MFDVKTNVDLKEYFRENLPSTDYNSQFIRTTNSLMRHGITAMDALCEMSDEKLMRVRNFGVKCFKATVLMREMYLSELSNTNTIKG